MCCENNQTQIRRILLRAEAPGSWWPWATRFVNELNSAARIRKRPDWPPFPLLSWSEIESGVVAYLKFPQRVQVPVPVT